MTKERSTALTTVLVLMAVCWCVVRRPTSSPDEPPAAAPAGETALVDDSAAIWISDARPMSGVEVGDQKGWNLATEISLPKEISQSDDQSSRPAPPAKLKQPKNAAPLFPPHDDGDRLRAIIRRQLPNATPEQIRIWEKKLKGMPLHMARELLELRQQFPLRDSQSSPKIAPPPPKSPLENWKPLVKRRPKRDALPEPLRTSMKALKRSRDVLLNNLANARTPGFKRSRVVLGSAAGTANGGVTIAAVQRDWSPGKLIKTGRKLDVAIEGEGFFVLMDANRRVYYTRCGNFERDPEGGFLLAGSNGKYRAQLTIAFSISAQPKCAFPLQASGYYLTEPNDGRPSRRVYGPFSLLKVVTFRNPDGLQPIGGNLFVANDASGPPEMRMPKDDCDNILKTGVLESSNVDTKRELAELAKVAEHMRMLQDAAKMFNGLATPTPSPLPIAKPPAKKPTAARKPRHPLGFDAELDSETLRKAIESYRVP